MTTNTKTTPSETGDELPLALRAHIVQLTDDEEDAKRLKKRWHAAAWLGWPATVLALDFETTTDATQALLFGSYRFAKWLPNGKLWVREEGLVYADQLPKRDRAGHRLLL